MKTLFTCLGLFLLPTVLSAQEKQASTPQSAAPALDEKYLRFVIQISGLAVVVLVSLILAAAFMHVSYVKAAKEHPEDLRIVGEFYQSSGLKMLTVIVIIFAVLTLAFMRLVDGSAVIGVLSSVAGYVLGSLNKGESEKPPKKSVAETNAPDASA